MLIFSGVSFKFIEKHQDHFRAFFWLLLVSNEFYIFRKSAYVFEKKGKTFLYNKGDELQKVADGGFITKVPYFCCFRSMWLWFHRRVEGRGFNWGRLACVGKGRWHQTCGQNTPCFNVTAHYILSSEKWKEAIGFQAGERCGFEWLAKTGNDTDIKGNPKSPLMSIVVWEGKIINHQLYSWHPLLRFDLLALENLILGLI